MRNAPEVWLGLELYWQAFLDLHSCRQIGMAEGPITWLVIEEYRRAAALDDDQAEALHYIIRKMDDAYLSYQEGKRPKAKGAAGGAVTRQRPTRG